MILSVFHLQVFVGSPAEGELHRGDIIVAIENHDATGLLHKQAQDLFKSSGGSLSLRVRRYENNFSCTIGNAFTHATLITLRASLKPAANESQKIRNMKQETKRFSTFAVYRLRHS